MNPWDAEELHDAWVFLEYFSSLWRKPLKISLAHAFSTSKKKRIGEGVVVTDLSPLSPKVFLSRLHSLRTERRTSGFKFLAARTGGGSSSQTSRSPSSVSAIIVILKVSDYSVTHMIWTLWLIPKCFRTRWFATLADCSLSTIFSTVCCAFTLSKGPFRGEVCST